MAYSQQRQKRVNIQSIQSTKNATKQRRFCKTKFDILETDNEISEMSKNKFKKIIKEKIEAHAIKYLNDIANINSKSKNIKNEKFQKMRYISDRRFTKDDI